MRTILYVVLGSILTGCASDFPIGDFNHYSETIENDPKTIRKSHEIIALVLSETYLKEEK